MFTFEIYLMYFFPTNIYLFKINNRNTRKRCGICLKLTIKHQNDVNDVILVFLSIILGIFHTFFSVSIVDFEQVNVSWAMINMICVSVLRPDTQQTKEFN